MRVRREYQLLAAEAEFSVSDSTFSLAMFRQILREDAAFRSYMFWMSLYGSGNLMMTAQLVVLFSDRLQLGGLRQILLLTVVPLLLMPLFLPAWARLFDRGHQPPPEQRGRAQPGRRQARRPWPRVRGQGDRRTAGGLRCPRAGCHAVPGQALPARRALTRARPLMAKSSSRPAIQPGSQAPYTQATRQAGPERWDKPFSPDMKEVDVDLVLAHPIFYNTAPEKFPAAIPLRGIAHGFARYGTGNGMAPDRAAAAAAKQ